MLFITSRQPTINTEPELNTNFVFDLENNSSSRGFFLLPSNQERCARRSRQQTNAVRH